MENSALIFGATFPTNSWSFPIVPDFMQWEPGARAWGVSGSQFSVKPDFPFRGPLSQLLGLFRSASPLLPCCARDLGIFLGETEYHRFRFASQCTMGFSFKAHHALTFLPGRNGQGPSSPGNSTVTPSSLRDSLLSISSFIQALFLPFPQQTWLPINLNY